MDLSQLKFPLLTDSPVITHYSDETPKLLTDSELAQSAADSILCQNCGKNPRKDSKALLCEPCIEENALANQNTRKPEPMIEISRELKIAGIETVRSLEFAPVSVRYAGKELDAIAWSMLPAIPDDIKLEIQRIVAATSRTIVANNPTIQDMEVMALYFNSMSVLLQSLADREKVKLKIKARPIAEKKFQETKEKVRAERIQKSIPVDAVSKHTANVLLIDVCEIIAPVDKQLQATLKKFLDHVSLEAQLEDTTPTKAWLLKQMSKPLYLPLKQYFKFKS